MSKKSLSSEQRKKKREESAFRRKITNTFKNAGFEYLKTEGIHRYFGLKIGELDYVFLFENIILVCEDTTTSKQEQIKTHLKNKKLLTDEIVKDKAKTVQWLKDSFPEKFEKFNEYSNESYKTFHLYFPLNKVELTKKDEELYSPIRVVELAALNYLHVTSQTIKKSACTEIFRLLELRPDEIGLPGDGSPKKSIPTPIIYPTDSTGLKNGVRIVSFMMSAEMLLKNSFVLRKDNWEGTIKLYQRLLHKSKLLKTRKYIANNQATFFNNIIVSLPVGVTFENSEGTLIDLKDIHRYENCRMNIPDEMNSICVIDGQHRIFAHYEGNDDLEPTIKKLRQKLHLLVTGLIFPENMSDLNRRKYESAIFEDINSNAKPVPADVLLQIKSLQEPFSDLAIARRVIALMNNRGVFRDRFQMSQMDGHRIKVASIIKYALRYLVDITEDTDKPSLFQYWSGDKVALLKKDDEDLLNDYTDYIVGVMNEYFGAVKGEYAKEWTDLESKVLSITSINGFIIALRKSLNAHGVGDKDYYTGIMKLRHHDFSKAGFGYGSSHYNKFAEEEILPNNFKLRIDVDNRWIK